MCATANPHILSLALRKYRKREWHVGAHLRRIVWSKDVSVGAVVLFLITLGVVPFCQVLGTDHTIALRADSEREFDEFLHWAQERGLQLSAKLKMAKFPRVLVGADVDVWGPHVRPGHAMHHSIPGGLGFRGLVAVEDIGEGERICNIPYTRLSLTAPTPLHAIPSPGSPTQPGWASLALHLLHERKKGKTSAWYPYLNILPAHSPLPLSLPPPLWSELQWPLMERQLADMRVEIEKAFAEVALPHFGLEDFVWAVSMVHSRAFSLVGVEYVMIPFMDAINHHHDNNAEWSLEGTRSEEVDIVARRRIRKGEEVFVSFGPRSNDNLLLYYGFVLDNNPFDVARLFPHFEAAIEWQLNLHCMCNQSRSVQDREVEDGGKSCREASTLDTAHEFARATDAMRQLRDRADGGKAGLSPAINASEWWDLMNEWGDLGYAYMPYRPGPDVRSGGRVDPNLVVAFSAQWGGERRKGRKSRGGEGNRGYCQMFVRRLRTRLGLNSASVALDFGDMCKMEGNVDVAAIRVSLGYITSLVFKLCSRKKRRWQKLILELRDYIRETVCNAKWERGNNGEVVDVERRKNFIFFARLEIAMKALELLTTHATSPDRDRMILLAPPFYDNKGRSSKPAHNGSTTTVIREAIVQHRLMRKRVLIACVHKLLSAPI